MDLHNPRPSRLLTGDDEEECVPVYVVWEITLACNLSCGHCGSRAGDKRDSELSTQEAFDLVDHLARLGTREITIIGGEAFLRKDWLSLIAHIASYGITCSMQTGGFGLSRKMLQAAYDAGLAGVGVSIDGLKAEHDELRGRPGSFDYCLAVLKAAREIGLSTSVNTQLNARSIDDLEDVYEFVLGAGASFWQLQWTVAMGNAVDNDTLLIQPYEVKSIMDRIAVVSKAAREHGVTVRPGNNIGYFGPHESLWRGPEYSGHYSGCPAGHNAIGIEADGTIKACPSLPAERYGGGNIRDISLEEIWEKSDAISFNRSKTTDDLWGFCASCYYAEVCRGGCTWTADSLFGRRGNNPYCYYRADSLEKQGFRERVEKIEEADDTPFSTGLFELVLERIVEPGNA